MDRACRSCHLSGKRSCSLAMISADKDYSKAELPYSYIDPASFASPFMQSCIHSHANSQVSFPLLHLPRTLTSYCSQIMAYYQSVFLIIYAYPPNVNVYKSMKLFRDVEQITAGQLSAPKGLQGLLRKSSPLSHSLLDERYRFVS